MRLSKRIYKLAEMVRHGDSAADIGTDHGYVPMLLLKNGTSPRVIMSDISEGSLAKARETFRLCGLMDRVSDDDFRVGDGLATIGPGEVDEIIIGGLGGHTIAGIMAAARDKSRSFGRYVLQPRKHSGSLRYWLYVNGWDIESEHLAPEGKFACEIITAVPSPEICREAPYPEDDIRWKYPEYLTEAGAELASKRIEWKMGSIEEQMENMSRSSAGEPPEIDRLRKEYDYLKQLLK